MHIDFAFILTLLTLITGVIWLADRFWLRRRRRDRVERGEVRSEAPSKPVEYARSFFPVLLLVLVFRSFLFEPFKIPSGSMIPTLWVGDFIVVSKFSYGIRLPVINKKILETGEPQRGDVIVFRFPEDTRVNYIKRVVGLPGDTVSYRNKMVFVNGEPVVQEPDGLWVGEGLNRNPSGTRPQRRLEFLDEQPHNMVVYPERPAARPRTWEVPQGHYFVLGDNRDQSLDSRSWGFVSEDLLVGKAVRIWMHWDCGRGCVDFSRIGDRIE